MVIYGNNSKCQSRTLHIDRINADVGTCYVHRGTLSHWDNDSIHEYNKRLVEKIDYNINKTFMNKIKHKLYNVIL